MKAAVITVGDELVCGEKLDTNFPKLAQRLAGIGVECALHETVGDDPVAIARAVMATQAVAGIVVVTGGLGPTSDDVTREGVARALGRELTFNDAVAARLSARFPEADPSFLDVILKQAYAVEKAEIIMPRRGTAPGLILFDGDQALYVLPGVPAELDEMLEETVVPEIVGRLPDLVPLERRVVRTAGILEAEVQEAIGDLETVFGAVRFGMLAHAGLVDVILTSRASEIDDVDAAQEEIESRLAGAVYGTGEVTLAEAVGAILRNTHATLAIAESCTAGLLAKIVTDVPGSSDYFVGGLVSYADDVKTALLGVDPSTLASHGAVSEPVARQMAEGVRSRLNAHIGMGVTGVAGPGGGSRRTPVGTAYVAIADETGTGCARYVSHGDRSQVRLTTAHLALNELRARLAGTDTA